MPDARLLKIAWELAENLSPAQKRALLWLPPDGTPKQEDKPRLSASLWSLTSRRVMPDVEAHLVVRSGGNRMVDGIWEKSFWHATPLGLMVRECLSKDLVRSATPKNTAADVPDKEFV